MASNATGTIAVYAEAVALAAYKLNLQLTGLRLRQVPVTTGTAVTLPPSTPNDGDSYEVIDQDGSVSPTHPVVITPPAGTTIRGAATFTLQVPFSYATLMFDGLTNDWNVQLSAGGGGAGTEMVIVPNIAALAALSTSGMETGQLAAVQSVGAFWSLTFGSTLTPDGITVINASSAGNQWQRGATWIAEASQAQTTYHIDPLNPLASDENTGLAGSPLIHKAEVYRRWGTYYPDLQNAVTFFQDSVGTAAQEKADPYLHQPTVNGVQIQVFVALPAASFTGSLLAVTAKVNNANPGNTLQSTFTVTTGAIAAGMLLVNATRANSSCRAQRNLGGGNWQLSQPLAAITPGTFQTRAENNAWANGDTITGYMPQGICMPVISTDITALGAAIGGSYVYQANFIGDATQLMGSGAIQLHDCSFTGDSVVSELVYPGTFTSFSSLQNCYIAPAFILQLNGAQIYGGVILPNAGEVLLENMGIGQDCIWVPTPQTRLNTLRNSFFSGYLDTGSFLNAEGWSGIQSLGGSVVYGPGTLNSRGTFNMGGTAATRLFCAGIQLNGVATGYSMSTAAGITTIHGGIALTAANIDAAAGAAGFGGSATNLMGSTITNAAAQP